MSIMMETDTHQMKNTFPGSHRTSVARRNNSTHTADQQKALVRHFGVWSISALTRNILLQNGVA